MDHEEIELDRRGNLAHFDCDYQMNTEPNRAYPDRADHWHYDRGCQHNDGNPVKKASYDDEKIVSATSNAPTDRFMSDLHAARLRGSPVNHIAADKKGRTKQDNAILHDVLVADMTASPNNLYNPAHTALIISLGTVRRTALPGSEHVACHGMSENKTQDAPSAHRSASKDQTCHRSAVQRWITILDGIQARPSLGLEY